MAISGKSYLELVRERAKTSRVYQKHQLTGLLIAEALHDEAHKSLYIKLAKQYDGERLFALAKQVGAQKQVRNKGAYFMKLLHMKSL